MEEVIKYKEGWPFCGTGEVKVSREEGGSVFIDIPNPDDIGETINIKLAPEIAVKVGDALIRMGTTQP